MRLKELRLRQNLNQKDIAKYINKTTQAYSLYERGERDPDSATLILLADFFDVSLDYLLGRTDQSKPTIPPVEKASGDLPQEALDRIEEFKDLMRLKYGKNQ
ncbi:Transcriptional regulator, contains XRE-family HTH domain [Propionispira arboris]|jgi:transcriptional regulator with XRE-family HTH domain|uniref:Transcriptional regulator, contains XRE-family HTH domain n=1 Tax=Propionispira arboris TaxID=84035 RepID=A0A1H6WN34_9FIRM|nr:helix-turn-helix transcriptional regulator [Propionispira arboris]SEJ18308.1 Transcriptional regulator, contains XRE-family HTH domain [Propionispira arboris]